ncbi:MAG TPA: ATP-binding protein [Pseudonocardiaceae bacterium]|nr:ATP-binding protein [Pseudonocardiaceae bacterium]
MRIAFIGKGGSGKTTLSALFTRYLVDQGLPVLAIDADINQHLGQALGLDDHVAAAIPALGSDLAWLKDHLRGNNPRITSAAMMIKTTPPGSGSRLLRYDPGDELHRRFARPVAGAHLMVTGEFAENDIGVACYHSKTGAVELYLNHLIDTPAECVVVDMTAGADAFASGLFTRFDLIVLVCEPTRRGIRVYQQFRQHMNGHQVRLRAIGNKVTDHADAAYLRSELGEVLLGNVAHSSWVRAAERGDPPPFGTLEPPIRTTLAAIYDELAATERDWAAYHRDTVRFHLRNASAWANRSAGADLAEQVDPDFVPGPAALSTASIH